MKAGDLVSGVQLVEVTTPADVIATGESSNVDLNTYNFEGVAGVHFTTAQPEGTNPTLKVELQTSSTTTTGDFATVLTVVDLSGTAAAQKGTVYKAVDANALKRYIRLKYTLGGTATPKYMCAASVLGFKKIA
jgi:hypothetical protein